MALYIILRKKYCVFSLVQRQTDCHKDERCRSYLQHFIINRIGGVFLDRRLQFAVFVRQDVQFDVSKQQHTGEPGFDGEPDKSQFLRCKVRQYPYG